MEAAAFLDAPTAVAVEVIDSLAGAARDDALYMRCRHDVELFGVAFFPQRFRSPWNGLARWLFERPDIKARQAPGSSLGPSGYKRPWKDRGQERRDAIAAPRGHAKSTIVSWLDLLHDVVYGFEVFVPLISTDQPTADQLAKDLFDVFTDADGYAEFHALYGPFRLVGTKTDFAVYCATSGNPDGTKFRSYTARGSIRGHKHRGWRPSKIVYDDLEHPKGVLNPATRDETELFMDSDAGEAGDEYTIFQFIGTLFHPDAVLNRKLHDNRWNAHHYRALIEWPQDWERRDEKGYRSHWVACRKLWADLDTGDADQRRTVALAYYREHKAAMDEGAVVLWPENRKQCLFSLMVLFWEKPQSFYTEKQNQPGKSEDLTFDASGFRTFWLDDDHIVRPSPVDGAPPTRIPLAKCKIGVWLDPIPQHGKGTGSDDAALATVARCPSGYFYVLSVALQRIKPDEQMGWLWGAFDKWGPRLRAGYENNTGFTASGDHWDELAAARAAQGSHKFRPEGQQTRGQKGPRIATIQPECANGFVMFNRTLPAAVHQQFEHFPYGRHDDAPDAIERAIHLLKTHRQPISNVRI